MQTSDLIKATQRKVGVIADGVAGADTWAAIVRALGIKIEQEPEPEGIAPDSRSQGNIATLLLPVQSLARKFLAAVNAQLPSDHCAKIISGTRTYAEQDALFAQGRTKPGKRVTNAPAGYSNHNFGIAWDIGIFRGSEYLDESPLYDRAGEIGKLLGLAWGGDWKSIQDKPHFEFIPDWAEGMSEKERLAGLRERKAADAALV